MGADGSRAPRLKDVPLGRLKGKEGTAVSTGLGSAKSGVIGALTNTRRQKKAQSN